MEENIREAMTAAHDNMQEKMQEKVAEVKNTLDSLEGTSRANRFTVTGYTIYNAVLLVCYLAEVIKGSRTGGYSQSSQPFPSCRSLQSGSNISGIRRVKI